MIPTTESASLTRTFFHILCLSPRDLQNQRFALFCADDRTVETFIGPKDSTLAGVHVIQVSDLNSEYFRNSVPKHFKNDARVHAVRVTWVSHNVIIL